MSAVGHPTVPIDRSNIPRKAMTGTTSSSRSTALDREAERVTGRVGKYPERLAASAQP
jgi:hypothetical protein